MAQENSLLASWVQVLVPQPCYDEFFVNFNFFDVACFKIVLSKGLGFAIILGSILVKVPQILKISNSQSGKGISLFSTTLELAAVTATLAYGFNQGFPFSAYGEAIFLVLQTLAIAFLVLKYSSTVSTAIMYTSVYTGILTFLMSPAMPQAAIWYLQASVLPNVVLARMIQAYTNLRNQSTGQLSVVTFALLFLGSMARVFTSVQETGDSTVILIYIASSLCNGVILSQILYYGDGSKTKRDVRKKRQ